MLMITDELFLCRPFQVVMRVDPIERRSPPGVLGEVS